MPPLLDAAKPRKAVSDEATIGAYPDAPELGDVVAWPKDGGVPERFCPDAPVSAVAVPEDRLRRSFLAQKAPIQVPSVAILALSTGHHDNA